MQRPWAKRPGAFLLSAAISDPSIFLAAIRGIAMELQSCPAESVDQQVRDTLLCLNVAGWQTVMAGEEYVVVFLARHRRTGDEAASRAPVWCADDAVRHLAERCRLGSAGGAW